MPQQEVIDRAREDEREGKSPSTQAGEFVHEEIEHVKRASTEPAPPNRRSPSAFRKRGERA